ncbi:MAG: HAMP domain-containing protein [Proteobacteria bacterium]|nr:HAMP domain-containing protein [Pseudomonadota bacterium]
MAAFKRFLPKTFLARALTILILPVLILQGVMTYVFVDRHLSKVSELLAGNIATQVALATKLWDAAPQIQSLLAHNLSLHMEVRPPQVPVVGEDDSWGGRYLARALHMHLPEAFYVHVGEEVSRVWVYHLNQTFIFSFETKQLSLKTTSILLWWALGAPLLLLLVATLFMRNQVRPLRQLALAVENFGKGRETGPFEPKGALEVRRVAKAFHAMRERITRQREQRTQMLAGVSHDLRTPLTRMGLQLAVMGENEDVQALRSDLEEMTATLESYLSFARGEGTERASPIEGNALLTRACGTNRQETLTLTLSDEDWYLMGRPHALYRSLRNLIENGVRYAPHTWVSVKLKEEGVIIIVDDNGPGIPSNKREDVFKPFVRLEGSRNPATGGTGLGLAIARDIARSHGGDITLEDSPKGGLRASLLLPY